MRSNSGNGDKGTNWKNIQKVKHVRDIRGSQLTAILTPCLPSPQLTMKAWKARHPPSQLHRSHMWVNSGQSLRKGGWLWQSLPLLFKWQRYMRNKGPYTCLPILLNEDTVPGAKTVPLQLWRDKARTEANMLRIAEWKYGKVSVHDDPAELLN